MEVEPLRLTQFAGRTKGKFMSHSSKVYTSKKAAFFFFFFPPPLLMQSCLLKDVALPEAERKEAEFTKVVLPLGIVASCKVSAKGF